MVTLGGFSRVVKEISAKRSAVDVVDVAVVVQERSHCVRESCREFCLLFFVRLSKGVGYLQICWWKFIGRKQGTCVEGGS